MQKSAGMVRQLGPIAGVVLLTAALLSLLSHLPADVEVPVDPTYLVVALMMAAGAAYLALPWALQPEQAGRGALAAIILVGLALRLFYLPSAPIYEIDFFRYLWDGAAVAAGLNPYDVSPAEILSGQAPADWAALGAQAGGVLPSINYPELRTIYPPLAQAAFALAHWLSPWDLTALRLVLLAAELVGLGLLLALLKEAGRAPHWVALYWWNPLVAKELVNSAHMDSLLFPFVLGALLLAIRLRPVLSSGLLALAAAVKLWPVLLLPLVLRPLLARWRLLLAATGLFVLLTGLLFIPVLVGKLDHGSGFVAYAQDWQNNSALFTLISGALAHLFDGLDLGQIDAGRAARALVALMLLTLAATLGFRPAHDARDLCRRALFVIAALYLLSPTGYPWYFLWFAPLLAIVPVTGLLALTALLPLYYLRFSVAGERESGPFDSVIVWIEFTPVFLLLLWDWLGPRVKHLWYRRNLAMAVSQ